MKKNLLNEFDLLESVIVHTPGLEHVFGMTPKNLNPDDKENYLLFDDLLFLDKAEEEHNIFTSVIKKFTGDEKCFELKDLLEDVLVSADVKNNLLNDLKELYWND